jgi:hypothetical protein
LTISQAVDTGEGELKTGNIFKVPASASAQTLSAVGVEETKKAGDMSPPVGEEVNAKGGDMSGTVTGPEVNATGGDMTGTETGPKVNATGGDLSSVTVQN